MLKVWAKPYFSGLNELQKKKILLFITSSIDLFQELKANFPDTQHLYC